MSASKITIEDLDNMVKRMEEAEKIPPIESFYENAYCCLLTGEIVRYSESPYGDMYCILMGPRGVLAEICGRPWWMFLNKTVWEGYLKDVEKKGWKRGQGPFQLAARSLPVGMGGTGRLVDMFPDLKEEERKAIEL